MADVSGWPRGTVTFLFTDIAGSTRLWQDYPAAMAGADLRHDALLRRAIAAEAGVAYKVVGDAFQAAFPTASQAVAAAVAAQRALLDEDWSVLGLPVPLRVRMALHTVAAAPTSEGDYRTPGLNRLGRLLATAAGGQVLLSGVTAELAHDHLPLGGALRDLGPQRLKDLYRPEHVYELVVPASPGTQSGRSDQRAGSGRQAGSRWPRFRWLGVLLLVLLILFSPLYEHAFYAAGWDESRTWMEVDADGTPVTRTLSGRHTFSGDLSCIARRIGERQPGDIGGVCFPRGPQSVEPNPTEPSTLDRRETETPMGGGQATPSLSPTPGERASGCTPRDPAWESVDRWGPEISEAGQQVLRETRVLVPANVVKVIMRIESGGNPDEVPAAGLLQVTAGMLGVYDLDRARSDPYYGVWAGTTELALRYLDSGRLPWENVAVGYFSGHDIPNGSEDLFSSDNQYQIRFNQFMADLEAECRGLASIWGNVLVDGGQPVVSQEFGPTEFTINVHPEWYAYALDYGFTLPGNTGLDIGLPAGTPLYAPFDATVVCAGTGIGTGEDPCAAFASSYGGPTSGRLQMKLANGDMLILGHVNQTIVPPGATVLAGQQIGISGGFNGDFVHIEYRAPDPETPSCWRVIDPRAVFEESRG